MGSAYSRLKDCILSCIRGYQRWISPMLAPRCRFYPSCSQYTIEAITEHGLFKGGRMGFLRLLRCHPFHSGGADPVPKYNQNRD